MVPCFEGTLAEERFAVIREVDLAQLEVPLDLAHPVEEPLEDVPTAAVVMAVPFLS